MPHHKEASENLVSKPSHYIIEISGHKINTITFIFELLKGVDGPIAFCYGNILKYILRANRKNQIDDFKKAKTYTSWILQEMEYSNKISLRKKKKTVFQRILHNMTNETKACHLSTEFSLYGEEFKYKEVVDYILNFYDLEDKKGQLIESILKSAVNASMSCDSYYEFKSIYEKLNELIPLMEDKK